VFSNKIVNNLGFLLIIIMSCSLGNSGDHVIKKDGKIFVRDRDGWDMEITHAVSKYGMDPYKFYFGIGVDAIRSVDNPKIYSEGESGYPSSNSSMQIFGAIHNGESRAYGVSDIGNNEVFNEKFPDGEAVPYVAVAY